MKIVVAGKGFISSYLVKRLEKDGHKVKVISHNSKAKIPQADYYFYLFSYGNHYHQKAFLSTFKANLLDYYKFIKSIDKYKALVYFSTSSVVLSVQTNYSISKYLGERLSLWFAKKYNKPITVIQDGSITYHERILAMILERRKRF